MSNIKYTLSDDRKTGYGKLSDGAIFTFDADMIGNTDEAVILNAE